MQMVGLEPPQICVVHYSIPLCSLDSTAGTVTALPWHAAVCCAPAHSGSAIGKSDRWNPRLQSRQLSAAACCCCFTCWPLLGHQQLVDCCWCVHSHACDSHSLPPPPHPLHSCPTHALPQVLPPYPSLPVQEAQWMLDQGIQPDSNCASRGIGYRQALAALQHWHAHPDDLQPSQLVPHSTPCEVED